jgi:hypothetical protein
MTQDRRPRILLVQKLVQKQMDRRSERVERKVTDVFEKVEDGEG